MYWRRRQTQDSLIKDSIDSILWWWFISEGSKWDFLDPMLILFLVLYLPPPPPPPYTGCWGRSGVTDTAAQLCKAKRQYLLTCKVSRYCLLALRDRAASNNPLPRKMEKRSYPICWYCSRPRLYPFCQFPRTVSCDWSSHILWNVFTKLYHEKRVAKCSERARFKGIDNPL